MGRTKESATTASKGKGIATKSAVDDRGKKRSRDGRSQPRKSSADPLRSSLELATIHPTRFVDWDTMVRLGVREDMEALFNNLSLSPFMHLREFTHGTETIEFLSSLVAAQDDAESRYSAISFTIHGQTYMLTVQDLCDIYGFVRVAMTDDDLSYHGGMIDLWHRLAGGSFQLGKVKASHIRNPAIKLVQKALGFSFFGRFLVGPLTKEEWRMICYALRPFTAALDPPVRSVPSVDPVTVFIANLLGTQDIARAKKAASWPLCIGGALTPIFRHCGIELSPPVGPIPFLDMDHLYNCRFLTRSPLGTLTYPFSWGNHATAIDLPAPELVSLLHPHNIVFQHIVEAREQIEDAHALIHEDAAEADEAEDTTTDTPIHGSGRYHFEPLADASQPPVVRQLAKQNSLLQRWVKWQGRTIEKMARTITSLKRRMRSMEKHTGHVSSSYLAEGRTKARYDRTASPQSSNPSLELDTPPDSDSASDTP